MENNENMNNQVSENNNTQPEVVNQNNIVDNNNQQVVKDNQALVENEPKKSNVGLIVLLMLIIVGVGGFFVYTKFIAKEEPKGNDNPTPTPINNNQGNNNQNTNNDNIDLSQVTTSSFTIDEMDKEKLDVLQKDKSFEIGDEISQKVKVNGKKVSISFKSDGKTTDKEYNNVSKVLYTNYGQCSPEWSIFVFSNNKIYMIDEDNNIKEIDNVNNYTDIYIGNLHPRSCGFTPIWLGYTSDGKYYDLKSNTEYVHNLYFYYNDANNYIKNDMSYKFENNTGKIKMFFIDENDDELVAFIDENKYLYVEAYDDREDRDFYTKNSNLKVTKIQKQKGEYDDRIYAVFDDGSKTELGSYDLIKIYK